MEQWQRQRQRQRREEGGRGGIEGWQLRVHVSSNKSMNMQKNC
ncbi:MAG: hypothetical protein WA941_20175 [Nitrososphaeraceae archaeon]